VHPGEPGEAVGESKGGVAGRLVTECEGKEMAWMREMEYIIRGVEEPFDTTNTSTSSSNRHFPQHRVNAGARRRRREEEGGLVEAIFSRVGVRLLRVLSRNIFRSPVRTHSERARDSQRRKQQTKFDLSTQYHSIDGMVLTESRWVWESRRTGCGRARFPLRALA